MQTAKEELRMAAGDFDRIMRRALQTAPPPKELKAKKKTRGNPAKRRQK